MKNKRGFLLAEETLKIVLAVIAIVFLIYFLTQLYFSRQDAEKLKQAAALLENSSAGIMAKINNLNIVNPVDVHLFNPKSWYLIGFTGTRKPNQCAGQNCLCICEGTSTFSAYRLWQSEDERQSNKCGEKGVCSVLGNFQTFNKVEIQGDNWITIKKESNIIRISKK